MISGAPLSQPIRGGVSHEGRLVFADEALRRLHHRAGGVEGGALAIPGLAALAALAHQLKMRLSRSVKVADIDEDLELWVEAQLDGEIARLSILSWRASTTRNPPPLVKRDETPFKQEDGRSHLQFDQAFRLIAAKGQLSQSLDQKDFGNELEAVLAKLAGDDTQIDEIVDPVRSKREFKDRLLPGKSSTLSLSGEPCFAGNHEFTGYQLTAFPVSSIETDKPDSPPPGVLFGRQLAPVLRQPLGRIIANAETIGSGVNGPIRENYALYAKDIANAARHLVALVDDLGDLEAVERLDFVTAKDRIELGDVARRVAGLLSLKAADHSIRIVVPDQSQQVPAVAEFRRVLQILLNLVTNAVRYSPDGTEILIGIATIDDAALITVSDQGAGIEPDDRERIFEKFERLGRSGDGGSGLGLYISRRLARAMGGELSVDNSPSGGARFTLRLPSN